jgi:hypothetical protein
MARPEQDPFVVARERARALELRAQGKTFEYIARDLGRPLSTAWKRFDDALNEARRARADEYVHLSLLRYEDMVDRLVQRMDVGGAHAEKIAPALAAVIKGERELLGVDAPKRVDLRVAEAEGADFGAVAELGGVDPEAEWGGPNAGQDEDGEAVG